MNAETPTEIMEATYQALCEHGYADMTVQRIADESSLSTAAIHYHFDTKEELLIAFLDYLIERFEQRFACTANDPRERLETFLHKVFAPEDSGDFPIALLELKAQAPYHEGYRERFLEVDRHMRDIVAEAVRNGIDGNYFDDADPDTVARSVVTMINGGHSREVSLGETQEKTRDAVEEYLELQLGWTPEVMA
ncbi:MAG: AcrR family transcriptional regulator [Natronomonas sp.]|jgi:AcrR family transcriptional regulator|uniref:TetR/AcrR family transcriptional regulator n=1 Tax=Natronomonas sp. TaxID=2184060 RepID=UPI00398A4666